MLDLITNFTIEELVELKAQIENRIHSYTANLLIEGIKSFYHKYCPQIEWKNAPNNN